MGQEHIKLRRSISWVQGAAMTIGAVLGSGILILPVAAAQMAGPASLVSWVLMGVLAVPLSMTLGSLAARCPEAGGIAAYVGRAFGPEASRVTGWLFLGTVPIGAPTCALIGANYVGALLGWQQSYITCTAALMLLVALVLNYRGIELSGKSQVAIVTAIVVILVAAVFAALPYVRLAAFTPVAPHGWGSVGSTMAMLFWAFVGWEMVVHLAEEFKNPQRDIPRSIGASVGIINLLYVAVAVVTVGTQAYLGPSGSAALAAMVSKGWGPWAGQLTALLGFVVCYGTIHTYVAGFSRLVYAQAREGYFPAIFARLHAKYQTPHCVLYALLVPWTVVLVLHYVFRFDIGILIAWPSAIFIALYILGMASALKLLPGRLGKFLAAFSLVVCVIVYGFTGWIGLYPIGLGVCGWFLYRRRERAGKTAKHVYVKDLFYAIIIKILFWSK